ncbi:ABC transporter permease [Anaerococcus porci]|uniref:ABC transporter permease n=1 Tax=Anaerococcus porci TaxID=2652269 RepID=UPI002A755766|nr:ABC transporter permease [Anaerococcus porci]MDY3006562.1 ABC transporter permease [Anaerococcus porci]
MKNKNTIYKNLIVFTIILVIWEFVFRIKIFSPIYLPGPYMVLKSFLEMLADGSLIVNIYMSLFRIGLGFILAFITALGLSLGYFLNAKVFSYLDGILNFLKNIPPLGLVPLLILWLGIGEGTKITMVFMASFFPLFLNMKKGFLGFDKELVEMALSFSYNKMDIFKKVILPQSLPDIYTGIRISLGYAYRSIIAAEMIAASSGLGYLLNFSRQMSRTDKVLVSLIVIGFLGLFTDYLLAKLSKIVLKGDLRNET